MNKTEEPATGMCETEGCTWSNRAHQIFGRAAGHNDRKAYASWKAGDGPCRDLPAFSPTQQQTPNPDRPAFASWKPGDGPARSTR